MNRSCADRTNSSAPSAPPSVYAALRGRIVSLYALLFAANAGVWLWAVAALHGRPLLLGTAVLAYSFGLRHAVDPDHIAAIDNVTRKLMQDGKRPIGVGLFFALGHSSVVVLAAVAVALTANAVSNRFDGFREIGGIVGTSVSALFLFVIAAMNLLILRGVYASFRRVRHTGRIEPEDTDILLAQGGVLARLFRPLFRIMTRSWQMFPLGLLFGLGFETATEVALLGVAADQASQGLSIWSVLVFPALFTVGMTLIDTTDGILMLGAYGWAFLKPVRKLYYNMIITLVSVFVALLIGGIEALGLVGDQFGLSGPFWEFVAVLNGNFGYLGYGIVGVFALVWVLSVLIYRYKGYDDLDVPLSVAG